MIFSPNNRAVSALFRVFGEVEPSLAAEAEVIAERAGMHRGEMTAFAMLIPLTILAACLHSLHGFWVLPVWLLTLHVLPFLLGMKSQVHQWRCWFALGVTWAIFHRHSHGWVGAMAYAWIGLAVMNLAASLVLAWQASMRWTGNGAMAWRLSLVVIPHMIALYLGWKFGWIIMLIAGALIAAVICYWVLNPSSQGLGPVICKTVRDEILITIDDGPDPHDTPILLALLDRYQLKAVFFMIGEKVKAHPEMAREVVRRGHEIGNHTFTHPQASFWCAGPNRTRREITACQEIIEEVTGKRPRYFRAPVGHRNLFTHPIVHELGMEVMAWNRRGFDAVEKDANKVLTRILPYLTKGDLVLLHEATPIAAEVLENVCCVVHSVKMKRRS